MAVRRVKSARDANRGDGRPHRPVDRYGREVPPPHATGRTCESAFRILPRHCTTPWP